jgi:hypothetical protein
MEFAFVVAIGNLTNGFEFYGPFPSITLAEEFAKASCNEYEEWFVNTLFDPNEVVLGSPELLNEDNQT